LKILERPFLFLRIAEVVLSNNLKRDAADYEVTRGGVDSTLSSSTDRVGKTITNRSATT